MLNKQFYIRLVAIFFVLLFSAQNNIVSATGVEPVDIPEKADSLEFNVKEFIFHHLLDSYGFHITNIGEKEITFPLPIIVKSQDRGWFVFLSSKLKETGSYEGFSVAHEGEEYPYKLVETLADGTVVRPLDFSITKAAFSLFVVVALMLWLFMSMARKYKRKPLQAPSGMQGVMEPIVIYVVDEVVKPAIGDKYMRYTPYMLTLFFFILFLNLMGMIPIFPFGANVTGNIVIPLFLAFCTYMLINISSTKTYWKHIFWPPGVPLWLKFPIPILPLIEFISSITKPIVLTIRLFANMMAGHLLTMVMMSMIFIFGAMSPIIADSVTVVSIMISMFMTVLHLLVALLQAYVFTLLSAMFVGMAMEKEH